MGSIIYALSADPITRGHINIIERALKTFDTVLVGIGNNMRKSYTFTLKEREQLVKRVLFPFGNRVEVKSYTGLLVDFAFENGIYNVIRGARSVADFDYERLLADINHGMSAGIETYVMIADQGLSHISSSAVKEMLTSANISAYVPLVVKEALEIKLRGQYRMGITGGIGSGKSYVEKEIVKIGSDVGLPITSIDMDKISRYILERSNELVHRLIRKRLRMELGDDIGLNSEMIDTSKVLKLIFDSSCSITNRKIFEGIMAEPIMHIVRRKLDQVKGLVFICSALFVELGFCDVVNNNFIFINCSEEIRRKRLISRGYTEKEIDNRFGAQLTSEDKLVRIRSLIAEQSYGKVIEYTNEESNEKALHDLVFRVFAEYQEKIY